MRMRFLWIAAFALALCALPARAQDGVFDADLDFLSPGTVYPHQSKDFIVRLSNETFNPPRQEWIQELRIQVPTTNYDVPIQNIESPFPLHPDSGKEWDGQYTEAGGIGTFIWKFLTDGLADDGDIREGEVLDFAFTVITDAIPTDGFVWTAISDSGAYDEGVAYFNPINDDDDDDLDDDDVDDDDDDDEDDWHNDDDDDDVGPPDIDDDDDTDGLVTPPEKDEEDKGCGN